jgi:Tfp pilus assembly protein PilF
VNRHFIAACGVVLTCLSSGALAAEKYWSYDYDNISVTGVGSASRAQAIAHDLHRLDTAVAAATNRDDFALVRGVQDKAGSQYRPYAFFNDIMVNIDAYQGDALFGAYFGYTGSILSAGSSFRYPSWYISGLSEVFAASSITRDTVTIGGFSPGRVQDLRAYPLIPMRVFLGLNARDPQLASDAAQGQYAAQSWFLVHLILIEREYHDNFLDYFKRLSEGQDQREAFAGAFTVGYDALDEMLQNRLAKGKISMAKVPVPREHDDHAPRKMSEAEAMGRLALLAERTNPQSDGPFKLATAALASDAQEEGALGALAQIQVRHHDYAKAVETAQHLCDRATVSPETLERCGGIYASLYSANDKAHPVPMDSAQLLERARGYYDRAMVANPENLAAWYGMTELLIGAKDVADAKEFLPKVRHVWAAHDSNEALARALANLSVVTGDLDSALKFTQVWDRLAFTDASRAQAEATEASLKKLREGQALMSDTPK